MTVRTLAKETLSIIRIISYENDGISKLIGVSISNMVTTNSKDSMPMSKDSNNVFYTSIS